MAEKITVEATITAPIEKIWEYWTEAEHITHWAFASDDWYVPRAENDLTIGGRFMTRMEARDRSTGFDFKGVYTAITPYEYIAYTIEDGRKVTTDFVKDGDGYKIIQRFEAENENTIEIQKTGWQAILNNFRKYVNQ